MYPGKAPDSILQSYPPTVIWTSEFDMYRRDNETFALRLKKVGKLADISIMPGVMHGYQIHSFESAETQQFLKEEKLAFKMLVES